jgi:hypothetical protein
MHFLSAIHRGPTTTLRDTTLQVYQHLNQAGLSPELELMEVYHQFDPQDPDANVIETRVSFLAWPEVYREQLLRVLGPALTDEIWVGGEKLTPFTGVDERAAWVADSLERLKKHTNRIEQFDILSRVALVRPLEEIAKFKKIYQESGDINKVIELQRKGLEASPTGGFIDPWWYQDGILHLSKVAVNREAYDRAETAQEIRQAYCHCGLIRQANDPKVDPIFCYRAAGWARQFWEPILEIEFQDCRITESILKGDPFCAWDYQMISDSE